MPGETERSSDPDSPGSSVKVVAVVLAILCVALAYGLYKRNSSAKKEAEATAKQLQSFTNQVAELQTKLALEHGTTTVAQSNQQYLLDHRTAELVNTSNRLVQTSLLLSHAQREAQDAQTDLQTKAAAIATLEAQREDLNHRLEVVPALQNELASLKEKLTTAQSECSELAQSLGRERVEKADLERKLDDPAFLRLQTRRAEENLDLRKRMASAGRIIASDSRVRLELEQDGSVRPTMPANARSKK